jgi:hypothetical protein
MGDPLAVAFLALVCLAALFLLTGFLIHILCSNATEPTLDGPLNSPIVSITANQILLDRQWRIDAQTRQALRVLSKHASLFVIVVVRGAAELDAIRSNVLNEFKSVIDLSQILFCQTAAGRASMVLHLEVRAHFDFDPDVIHQVSFFQKTVHIATEQVRSPHAAWAAESLGQFLCCQNRDFFRFLSG